MQKYLWGRVNAVKVRGCEVLFHSVLRDVEILYHINFVQP